MKTAVPNTRIARIAAGTLELQLDCEALPLEEMIAFASRLNPKRRYLFVNRLIGRHLPVQPGAVFDLAARVADEAVRRAPLRPPVLVIGMAETALGLAGLVHTELANGFAPGQVRYLHTSRLGLPSRLASRTLSFSEPHSHAPHHLLHLPAGSAWWLSSVRTLLIVDDEATTGSTAVNLLAGLKPLLPDLRAAVLATPLSWLCPAARYAMSEAHPELSFVSLVSGSFVFRDDEHWLAPEPPQAARSVEDETEILPCLAWGRGRFAEWPSPAALEAACPNLDPGRPVSVVAAGEFAVVPLLLARRLAQKGYDVSVQALSASPIHPHGDIAECTVLPDPAQSGRPQYLYNHTAGRARQTLLAVESSTPAAREAAGLIGAQLWTPPGQDTDDGVTENG